METFVIVLVTNCKMCHANQAATFISCFSFYNKTCKDLGASTHSFERLMHVCMYTKSSHQNAKSDGAVGAKQLKLTCLE